MILRAVVVMFVMFAVSLILAGPVAQPVVEIYQTSITQQTIDGMKKTKDIASPKASEVDYVSESIWDRLALAIYDREAGVRNFAPDPAYVAKKIEDNKTTITDEQYDKMKKAEQVVFQLRTEFSGAKTDIDSFVKNVWKSRGPELHRLNIASSPDDLRSYLLLLDLGAQNGSSQSLIGSRPHALPEAKEEFLKQVNDPSSNRSFHEAMSRIEQVKDAVAGKVTCSADELARGREYCEHERHLLKREAYLSGGLNLLLQDLKKENQVDRWIQEKIKQDAKFHDAAMERAFLKWEAKQRPRYREVFGPPTEQAK